MGNNDRKLSEADRKDAHSSGVRCMITDSPVHGHYNNSGREIADITDLCGCFTATDPLRKPLTTTTNVPSFLFSIFFLFCFVVLAFVFLVSLWVRCRFIVIILGVYGDPTWGKVLQVMCKRLSSSTALVVPPAFIHNLVAERNGI